MLRHDPRTQLSTHEVANQPPDLPALDLYAGDRPMRDAVEREGGGWAHARLHAMGAECGSEQAQTWGVDAERNPPQLVTFDRQGRRVDEVAFHPAYHALMDLSMRHGVSSLAWTHEGPGGHVAHVALLALLTQADPGVACPASMTYAAVPALRRQPEVADAWVPKILHGRYDAPLRPLADKAGVTLGMAMTEKQGGSDVRANATQAHPLGAGGPGGDYRLVGHKWFCSAPMSDAFLTLAYAPGGLTCFLVPRITPDGRRNAIQLMRLKDKLGNRSNASSEIEYHDAYAVMVGEEGRGVATIIDMVHHTRLDTVAGPLGIMRSAFLRAHWHVSHRRAFQKTLIDQPVMRAVLADLFVELEAATALTFRVARAYDEAEAGDEDAKAFARLAVALAKFRINKRLPTFVYECMECLGGGGYVEDSGLPRLYREAPLNSIWEGSGNVIALDVLRTFAKEPRGLEAVRNELADARGADAAYDRFVDALDGDLARPAEAQARRLTERLALALQACVLLRHGPPAAADAFCGGRLGGERGDAYGAGAAADGDAILQRTAPP